MDVFGAFIAIDGGPVDDTVKLLACYFLNYYHNTTIFLIFYNS